MQRTIFEVLHEFRDRASRQFRTASERIGTAAERKARRVRTATNAMNMLGVAIKAFIALAAVRMFTRWMGESIRLAAEQESAIMKLRTALDMTGRATDETIPSLVRYANEIQNITTVGNETALQVMGTLASLTKLNEDGIKEATRVSIGLSKALDMDLNAAALQVAKAIESDTNALVRYGVQVDMSADATGRLAQLVESTSHMFSIAESETLTYAGAVEQLKNAYGDWRKEVAGAIMQSGAVREFLQGLTQMFQTTTENMAKNTLALADVVAAVVLGMTHVIRGFVNFMNAANVAISRYQQFAAGIQMGKRRREVESLLVIHELVDSDEFSTLKLIGRDPGILLMPKMLGKARAIQGKISDEDISKETILQRLSDDIAKIDITSAIDQFDRIDDSVDAAFSTLIETDSQFGDLINTIRDARFEMVELGDATTVIAAATGDATSEIESQGTAIANLSGNYVTLERAILSTMNVMKNYLALWRFPAELELGMPLEVTQAGRAHALLREQKRRMETRRQEIERRDEAERAGIRIRQWIQAQTGQPLGVGLGAVGDMSRFAWQRFVSGDGDQTRWQAIKAAFGSRQFIGQAVGQVGQGAMTGGGRGALAGALPLIGSVFGPIGSAVGGLLGGLLGRRRRGEIAASPVYVQDVRSSDLLTELLNITKAGLAGASAGRINDISASLATQAVRT